MTVAVEISVGALDARVASGANKNGLVDVVKEVFLIVTARDADSGREESEAMSVLLKNPRMSTFRPLAEVDADVLTGWALSAIENDMAMSDYLERLKKDLTARVSAPQQTHRPLFGFVNEHGMERA